MGQGIKVAHIVALTFKTRAAALAEPLNEGLNLPEGIGDDGITGFFDIGFFPRMREVGVFLEQGMHGEVH